MAQHEIIVGNIHKQYVPAHPRYEIINHGIHHCQYFQGCGTAYTLFDHVVTGASMNAKDAYHDALESLYQHLTPEEMESLKLPRNPKGIRRTDKVPYDANEEYYAYVSIRYNLLGE